MTLKDVLKHDNFELKIKENKTFTVVYTLIARQFCYVLRRFSKINELNLGVPVLQTPCLISNHD